MYPCGWPQSKLYFQKHPPRDNHADPTQNQRCTSVACPAYRRHTSHNYPEKKRNIWMSKVLKFGVLVWYLYLTRFFGVEHVSSLHVEIFDVSCKNAQGICFQHVERRVEDYTKASWNCSLNDKVLFIGGVIFNPEEGLHILIDYRPGSSKVFC